jgi:hypothetical protein
MGALELVARRWCNRRDRWLLLGTLVPYFLLQAPISGWFYLHVPGAFFLGFPWRLLAMITTAAIILLGVSCQCVIASAPSKRRWALGILTAAAACQVVLCVRGQAVAYGRYDKAAISHHVTDLEIPTVGEYLPPGVGIGRSPPPRQPLIAWTNCRSVAVHGDDPTQGRHINQLEIVADSPAGCTVRLNQFFSPFLRVDGAPSSASKTRERTIEIAVPPGTHTVTVAKRGLLGVLLAARRG